MFNNFMPQSGHSEWKVSFLYPVTSFGETSRAWLSSRPRVSVRCCWIWKGRNPREAEAAQSHETHSVSAWRQSVASLCKKHFIKNASPIPVSLPLFKNQLQQRHSLLSMRFLIIRFLSLEGITFPQSTGWNPRHKLWDPYEGSRCF